jgi:UDP:flavonoid glycosyltransferase YjiC (YdhE family)
MFACYESGRTVRALRPLGHARAYRTVPLTEREFDFRAPLPPNVRYGGAQLDDPAWTEPWSPPPGDAPLVRVAMSSTYQAQVPDMQRIAAALGTLDVRGVITAGPALDPAAISAPANVQVVAAAPHAEVLREAAAVVTHGGHGTVAKSLAAGVPLLVMPMGRDQLDNAARVVARGGAEAQAHRASARDRRCAAPAPRGPLVPCRRRTRRRGDPRGFRAGSGDRRGRGRRGASRPRGRVTAPPPARERSGAARS